MKQLKHHSNQKARPSAGLLFLSSALLCYRGAPKQTTRKHRGMDSWKTLGLALLTSISTQALAAENNNPFQAALMITTVIPFVVVAGTTAATSYIPELFKPAKSDALAFIGSDGEIRGAQFEQASRYYRASFPPPLMSDQQLALAIATSF